MLQAPFQNLLNRYGPDFNRKYLLPAGGEMMTWFSLPATLTLFVTSVQLVVTGLVYYWSTQPVDGAGRGRKVRTPKGAMPRNSGLLGWETAADRRSAFALTLSRCKVSRLLEGQQANLE
jgi:hypothetical protein